jgi:hypothetical protein
MSCQFSAAIVKYFEVVVGFVRSFRSSGFYLLQFLFIIIIIISCSCCRVSAEHMNTHKRIVGTNRNLSNLKRFIEDSSNLKN